jgi:hypothetical protein
MRSVSSWVRRVCATLVLAVVLVPGTALGQTEVVVPPTLWEQFVDS